MSPPGNVGDGINEHAMSANADAKSDDKWNVKIVPRSNDRPNGHEHGKRYL